jgi:hypothetical protein
MPEQDEQKIIFSDDAAPFSVYTNRVELNLNVWDVRMQIMEVVGKEGDQIVIKRHGTVVMTPLHAKALLRALDSTLHKYEDKFGEIDLSKLESAVEVHS